MTYAQAIKEIEAEADEQMSYWTRTKVDARLSNNKELEIEAEEALDLFATKLMTLEQLKKMVA